MHFISQTLGEVAGGGYLIFSSVAFVVRAAALTSEAHPKGCICIDLCAEQE